MEHETLVGCDWLTVRCTIGWERNPQPLFESLESSKRLASESGLKSTLCEPPGYPPLLVGKAGHRSGATVYDYVVWIGQLKVSLSRNECIVEASGAAMTQAGWCLLEVWAEALHLLAQYGIVIHETNVSRVDLFADVDTPWQTFLTAFDAGQVFCRSSHNECIASVTAEQLCHDVETAWSDGEAAVVAAVRSAMHRGLQLALTEVDDVLRSTDIGRYQVRAGTSGTLYFGKSSIRCRMYDKSAEVAREPDRQRVMREQWGNHDRQVTRIEFQVRREAMLKRGILSMDDLAIHAGALHEYLMTQWLIIRTPGTRKNSERRGFSPEWSAACDSVRKAYHETRPFVHRAIPVQPAQKLVRQAVGCLKSAVAALCGTPDKVEQVITAAVSIVTNELQEQRGVVDDVRLRSHLRQLRAVGATVPVWGIR